LRTPETSGGKPLVRNLFWMLCVSLVVGASFAACGPTTPKCSPSSCTGCCDATGACQAGNSNLACGASGATCNTCVGAQSCSLGICSGLSGGGGGTTGGGGGATGGGGGSTGGGGGGSASTSTQFCLDIADQQVRVNSLCGVYSPAGVSALRSRYDELCRTNAFYPGLAEGRVRFDPTEGDACLAALRTATCTNPYPAGYYACSRAFVGTVTVNGACYQSTECTPDLYCDSSLSCPGRCVARKAIGQPVGTREECVAGAENYGGTCTAVIALGQSCAPTGGQTRVHQCAGDGMCDATETCVPWMPTLRRGNGESCDEQQDLVCGLGLNCVNSLCAPYVTQGNACDDTVRTCQQDLTCGPANTCVTYGAAGATCGSSAYVDCGANLFCNKTSSTAATGTCTPLRNAGETCTNRSGCAAGLFCTSTSTTPGVCRSPYAIGESCTYAGDYLQCGAGYCTATSTMTTGVCANKKATGATCTRYDECASSTCTSGRCEPPMYCYAP
jgi:hypothetical protein